MKLLQNKSKREKILVILLSLALAFAAYLSLRVKSLNLNMQKIEADIQREKKKYAKLLQETKDAKPSNVLEKEIAALEKQLEQERENLSGLEIKFVNLSDNEALHTLMKDITITAERHNLQLLGKENEIKELAGMVGPLPGRSLPVAGGDRRGKKTVAPINNNVAIDSSLKRHMFRLKLRGTFRSTYEFIRALHDMDRSILITRVKLSADDMNTYQGQRLINTELTLAI